MTLRHFRIFKAVAETGSFTKAAERLYITQSAVSHAIRELEERAGTALFDRLSKSISITESGRLLLEEVTPILASCDVLDSRLNCLEKQAPVHIVSSITIAAFYLPSILRKFDTLWPGLPVTVKVVPAATAVEVLRNGEADFALIEGAAPQGPFICEAFDSYNMYILCRPGYLPGYPAGGKSLSLERFCAERLLLREKGSAIRDTLDSTLYLAGCTAYPAWTSVNSTALIEAAKAGLGLTVLPDILVEKELEERSLITVRTDGLQLKNDLILLRHKEKYMTEPLRSLLRLISGKGEVKPG